MITQKTICLKLDKTLCSELHQLSNLTGINKNKLINYAVYKYVRHIDNKRQFCDGLISRDIYLQRSLIEPKF